MSKQFTPTTQQVKDAYVRAMRNAFVASAVEHEAEFERWLARIRGPHVPAPEPPPCVKDGGIGLPDVSAAPK